MLYDAIDEPESVTPTELREAYEEQLRSVVTDVGVETAAAETGVDRGTIEAIETGGVPELRLAEAASVLALDDAAPDGETILFELRDHLLMSMTTGVVDVDTIASNVDLDLSGQEIQQAIEGRNAMTLEQLAAIHHFLAERNDR